MTVSIPGMLATFVLFATGYRQFDMLKRGYIADRVANFLAVTGLIMTIITVSIGLDINGGRPTTGLMGAMLGALLLLIILTTGLKKPVHVLLIAVAPLTGFFTLIISTSDSFSTVSPIETKTLTHIVISIAAYGAVAFSGTLACLVGWHHSKLKQKPLPPIVASLPPFDAMEQLFLRTAQTSWILLSAALLTGIFYIEDFWAQHLAHKTALSATAWIVTGFALLQHVQQGGVTKSMRKTSIIAAGLLCVGYLGSKAILEFFL